ncbi:hypothetical protein AB0469_34030 [Streptomyces sp. NPDC093801]|uniref:hypothetical protein n=1 Tax=Streptomyces sp. NPDC093801 TaxID=3155203 RepID=UPI00345105C1
MTASDPYENVPTAMVYDTFAETATRLSGYYNSLSNAAATPEERTRWWEKVMELRDTKRAVPAHDRARLIAHIEQWRLEITRIKDARG